MSTDDVRERIEQILFDFERLSPQLRMAGLLLEPAIAMKAISEGEAVDHLLHWRVTHPDATPMFLTAVARAAKDHPSLRAQLVRLLWAYDGSRIAEGRDLAIEIRPLLPLLSPELRSVTFFLSPELFEPTRWLEGRDHVRVVRSGPNRSAEIPSLKDPISMPADSISGQRQRLRFLGYLEVEGQGDWSLVDRAAVTMFQFDSGLRGTGELDLESIERLDNLAWGTYYSSSWTDSQR